MVLLLARNFMPGNKSKKQIGFDNDFKSPVCTIEQFAVRIALKIKSGHEL